MVNGIAEEASFHGEYKASQLLEWDLPRHALQAGSLTRTQQIEALARSGHFTEAVRLAVALLRQPWRLRLEDPRHRRRVALALASSRPKLAEAFLCLPYTSLDRALRLAGGRVPRRRLPFGRTDPLLDLLIDRAAGLPARDRWFDLFRRHGLQSPNDGIAANGCVDFETLKVDGRKASVAGPLVSVVVPAFQAARTLRVALDGIDASTWGDLEIIVVDDGSTDATWQVASEFEQRTKRLCRLLRLETNQGTYRARNEGAAVAKGRFIICHDADDWSHPELIEQQMVSMSKHEGAACVSSDGVRIDESSGLPVARKVYPLIRWNPSSLLVPREAFEQFGYWAERPFGADMEFIARVATVGRHVRVRKPLALLRSHSKSITHRLAPLDQNGYSRDRALDIERWRVWHLGLRERGEKPFVPFGDEGPWVPRLSPAQHSLDATSDEATVAFPAGAGTAGSASSTVEQSPG